MDAATNQMIATIITQLPNFAGLLLALFAVLRQNAKLTEAMISLTRDCDCSERGETVLDRMLTDAAVKHPDKNTPI